MDALPNERREKIEREAAILVEREECAELAENNDAFPEEGQHIAALIRAR